MYTIYPPKKPKSELQEKIERILVGILLALWLSFTYGAVIVAMVIRLIRRLQ
jgi:hypothetical protein